MSVDQCINCVAGKYAESVGNAFEVLCLLCGAGTYGPSDGSLPRAAVLTVLPDAMWSRLVARPSMTVIFVRSAYISHRRVRLAASHAVLGRISTQLAMMLLPTASTV